MAIIYSYPDNENLLLTDMLIGTSTIRVNGRKKNITKNFTLEALGNFLSANFGPPTSPTLQQVTLNGNTTTTTVYLNGGAISESINEQALFQPDSISTVNLNSGSGATLDSTGKLSLSTDGVVSALFAADNITETVTFQAPNKAAGTYILATTADIPTAVTSVGLTMPSAFTVTNSPVTSSGTLTVTGAGLVSQYVRGDGTLANFPTSTGGGASVNYYLNGSVSQGTFGGATYYQMSKTPILGAGTNFIRTNGAGNGYIASFITDAGDPSFLNIPGGNWNLEFYFQSSASGGSPQFYGEIYKVSATNVFTLVASGSANPEGITNGTTVDQYFTSIPVPQTSLLITDRLAVRIYVITSGRTITLHTENGNLCEVLTTFTTGLTALNGLTQQVQSFATGTSGTDFAISSTTATHTFNLPTASAANRGALSSADWSTFNGKFTLPALTSGSVLFSNGTTIAQDNANLFWDDTNNRLGIGTATPLTPLHVSGAVTIGGATTIDVAATTNKGISLTNGVNGSDFAKFGYVGGGSNDCFIGAITNNNFRIYTQNTERVRFGFNGNVLIGTTTDAGFKLDVNGTARVQNVLTVNKGAGNFFTLDAGANGSDLVLRFFKSGSFEASISTQNVTSIGGFNVSNGLGLSGGFVATTIGSNLGFIGVTNTGANSQIHIASPQGFSSYVSFRENSIANRGVIGYQNGTSYFQIRTNGATNMTTGTLSTAFFSSGSVGINTTTEIASSQLTVESTTKGFLPPRMTNAQRLAIATPAVGLIVYCTDMVEGLYVNKSTGWTFVI